MNDVLAIILGGGQGSRLFPLTQQRSKPAVPIGGKYRLIDVPISNCLHADLRRIFVLTQFNSASLNHHVAQSYHMDPFSRGFVDIIAAEQTPDSSSWFQGTADAVRQAARHFMRYDADYYLILAGDHLYRMDYGLLLDAHVDQDADITVAALPVTPEDAPGMGLFLFDREGQIVGFEEKPTLERLAAIGSSVPPGGTFYSQTHNPQKPFIASMGIYVFSREVLLDLLQKTTVTDFGREIIPAALDVASRHGRTCTTATGPTSEPSNRFTRRTSCSPSRTRRSSSTIRGGRSTRTSGFCRRRICGRARSASRSWPMGAFSRSAPSSSR